MFRSRALLVPALVARTARSPRDTIPTSRAAAPRRPCKGMQALAPDHVPEGLPRELPGEDGGASTMCQSGTPVKHSIIILQVNDWLGDTDGSLVLKTISIRAIDGVRSATSHDATRGA